MPSGVGPSTSRTTPLRPVATPKRTVKPKSPSKSSAKQKATSGPESTPFGLGERSSELGRRWTVEEDSLLLNGHAQKLTVRDTVSISGLQRSISSSRRHLRDLLKRQGDDDLPEPASSAKRRRISSSQAGKDMDRSIAYYSSASWSPDDMRTLLRLMADGYDFPEIRDMPVAKHRTSESIRKKTKRLEAQMLREERQTETFPLDTTVVPGWTGMHSIHLRRAFREKMSFQDAWDRWFSDFEHAALKKKVRAYREQLRGKKPTRKSSDRESRVIQRRVSSVPTSAVRLRQTQQNENNDRDDPASDDETGSEKEDQERSDSETDEEAGPQHEDDVVIPDTPTTRGTVHVHATEQQTAQRNLADHVEPGRAGLLRKEARPSLSNGDVPSPTRVFANTCKRRRRRLSHSSDSRADEQLSGDLLQEAEAPVDGVEDTTALQNENDLPEVRKTPALVRKPSSSTNTTSSSGKLPQRNRLASRFMQARKNAASSTVNERGSPQAASQSRVTAREPAIPIESEGFSPEGELNGGTEVGLGRENLSTTAKNTHPWAKTDQMLYKEAVDAAKSQEHVHDCFSVLKLNQEQHIAIAAQDKQELERLKAKQRQQRRERRIRYGKASPRKNGAPLSLQTDDEESVDEEVERIEVDDSGVGYISESDVSCIWAHGKAGSTEESSGKSLEDTESDEDEENSDAEEDGKTTEPTDVSSHVSTDIANPPPIQKPTTDDASGNSSSSQEESSESETSSEYASEADTPLVNDIVQVPASQNDADQRDTGQAEDAQVSANQDDVEDDNASQHEANQSESSDSSEDDFDPEDTAQPPAPAPTTPPVAEPSQPTATSGPPSSWLGSISKSLFRFNLPAAPKPREEPKELSKKLPYGSDDEDEDSSSDDDEE